MCRPAVTRVAVYSRIADAIRKGLLTPGSTIPTQTELGGDMKVSRTVVREALMLLEEDGLIRARRGVGRFVSDTLPRIGIERIQPFYLAKCLVPVRAGHLSVMQQFQPWQFQS